MSHFNDLYNGLSAQHARLDTSYRLCEHMSEQIANVCKTIELHETIISDLVLNELKTIYKIYEMNEQMIRQLQNILEESTRMIYIDFSPY